jgi:LacI family transcriptional regulator
MTATVRRVALMLDLRWPYKRHADVFSGAQQYANEHGWTTVIDEFADARLAHVENGEACSYDGVIARVTPLLAEAAGRLSLPLVNVWVTSPARDQVPTVAPDYRGIGEQCAEHLLSRGFRSFAVVTAREDVGQVTIGEAFARRVHDAGFPCHQATVPLERQETVDTWDETIRVLAECVDACPKPLGVYLTDEFLCRIFLQDCRDRGLRVPIDVAVITGYNEETICEQMRPALTAIDMGYQKVGYEAARLLDRLMAGEPPPPGPIVVPSPGVIVRESTDYVTVANETVAAALAFIAANAHRPIGQDEVAEAVNAEARTLQNYFRKHLGRPIVAEIRRVRIERAKRKLVEGTRSIKEIARESGFGSSLRMYEVFLREGGRPEPQRLPRATRHGAEGTGLRGREIVGELPGQSADS